MLVLWFNICTLMQDVILQCTFSLASEHIFCYRSCYREFADVIYFIYLSSLNSFFIYPPCTDVILQRFITGGPQMLLCHYDPFV